MASGEDTMTGQVIGVDVGGTFTDLILMDPATGAVRLAKVPSTLDDQSRGVMMAVAEAGADLPDTALIVHGTTTTTNAVLERKLARTGMITTKGFRDVLELGRRTRPQAYGMKGEFTPLIPRDLRLEVPERMDAEGRVITPLDEEALADAARKLLALGCTSVVVHFLHSYRNPAHEARAGEVLRTLWPNSYITLGHALLSESREYERGVTAAVNASVQPILDRYVTNLAGSLAQGGYAGELLVMNGNGGMVSASRVAEEAARTVMSGPASGVMAAAFTGRAAGIENLLTYDMGGTSTDVALIRNAQSPVSNEIEIEYAMPIHVPMVDVRTVGAGGGSIARVNPAGLLEVGPESAGATPGPICYGRGGTEPTISDANLLLGRLDPARLKSVEGGVTLEQVRAIFSEKLGKPLGLTPEEAADAVIRLANVKMAGAIRMVSVSLGADPRDFALFAFGGAGPLHAAALARELGVPRVLVPARPGITNALGCLVADLRHDFTRTLATPLDTLDMSQLSSTLAAQASEGRALIAREKVSVTDTRVLHSVDMQFIGQTHLLRVDLPDPTLTREALQARFEDVYFNRFRVRLDTIRAAVVNANTSVIGTRQGLDPATLIPAQERKATVDAACRGSRKVRFSGQVHDTPLYQRDRLPADAAFDGPAILEQMDTTTLIPPGDRVTTDAIGNILIEIGAA
ncbi:hydantoinase/oxoprolinase family protein [Pseudooceanicola sediminis]|uniref:Hydantoinase/oxoprolinase family protein n=1 Tax=Pseudooceanicola sediminis TaxID=2211117 RepID=A0A399J7E6_9RHOB|nr:hydantoinase/oxoprolinase family protein [Pseudooceanicola sediminis]KAA2313859.1 hydantoinase/oxoprolinase family protein [Puniceibacterium sp. HSS470]RII38676.1 hydantoinase/oxoprolinase family protein [Pseudooceanicola sediminis]|tara:strand:+ start:42645 stop:44711 length:2067 start_codon:yes stop_codon:yes gene_type:complete